MKVLVKKLIALTLIVGSLVSCQDSTADDVEIFEAQTSLNKEEVLSMLESMIITYPVSATTNNATTTSINSDFDLEDYAAKTKRPKLTFPIEISVDGVARTVKNIKQLKELIRGNQGRKKPQFVFPFSVELVDGSTQEIANKEALRGYLDSLDEGVKPVFVFPLSVLVNGKTIVVSDINALHAIMGKPAKGRRPHFIFPISVVLEDGSTKEIADKEEFKAYLDTLGDGVKPVFVFPFSVEKNGETIVVNTQEEFNALVKKPKKGRRPQFVFPISVTLEDGSTKEIANLDELKKYHQGLPKRTRPAYVFPLSIIKNGNTIVINSQEELDTLCGK